MKTTPDPSHSIKQDFRIFKILLAVFPYSTNPVKPIIVQIHNFRNHVIFHFCPQAPTLQTNHLLFSTPPAVYNLTWDSFLLVIFYFRYFLTSLPDPSHSIKQDFRIFKILLAVFPYSTNPVKPIIVQIHNFRNHVIFHFCPQAPTLQANHLLFSTPPAVYNLTSSGLGLNWFSLDNFLLSIFPLIFALYHG